MQGGGGGVDQPPMQMVLRVRHPSSLGGSGADEDDGEGSSRSALSVFKAKEEQIERRKMEVREKVFAHLGRVEEESKRLAFIRQVRVRPSVRQLPSLCTAQNHTTSLHDVRR